MPAPTIDGYALIAGVGADLPVTVSDAQAIAAQLTDPQRCAYDPNRVRLLTEGDATRAGILDGLRWLADHAGPKDNVIVYYSGHGAETPAYYFQPFGFSWHDLAGTAISGDEFTAALRAIQAGKLLVLLDCCHAGGLAEAKGAVKSPLPPSLLETLQAGSGRVVIASSRRDEKSWTGTPYSVFTTALLEGLAGYGAFEQDGYARVLDIALWVGRKVPDRTGDKQHPIVKVSNLSDNYALAWYSGGDIAVKALPFSAEAVAPGAAVAPGGVNVAQRRTWRTMLANYRDNLLLIEERMSEYVDFTAIPLQLVKNKRQTETQIAELETKLSE